MFQFVKCEAIFNRKKKVLGQSPPRKIPPPPSLSLKLTLTLLTLTLNRGGRGNQLSLERGNCLNTIQRMDINIVPSNIQYTSTIARAP